MYETHAYAVGCHAVVDQAAMSRAAARTSEQQRAARERTQARKAQRKQRRVARRGQEHYTTAV